MGNGQEPDFGLGVLKTVEQLAAFNSVARALVSTLDLGELLERIAQTVAGLLGPRNWSLALWEPKEAELRVAVVHGAGAEGMQGRVVPLGDSVVGRAFEAGEPVQVEEAAATDPSVRRRFGDRAAGCSIIAVPLVVRGRANGIIELISDPGGPAFSEEVLTQVNGIAEFAAIAIENTRNHERVQELTLTDEVTGLYNSRHLKEAIEREVARATRFSHPLSVVFMDLDRFKQVNDTRGHQTGTALLREVGQLIRATIRSMDQACRYGGDEFALLLVETDLPGGIRCAERLCQAIRQHRFLANRGLAVQLTASLGVATFPLHAQTAVALIEAADKAMYAVKDAGRNGVRAARRDVTG